MVYWLAERYLCFLFLYQCMDFFGWGGGGGGLCASDGDIFLVVLVIGLGEGYLQAHVIKSH